MPTISYDFKRMLSGQVEVGRGNGWGNRKRNAAESTPLEIFVIETEPMIVFRERCNGRIGEKVRKSRRRTAR